MKSILAEFRKCTVLVLTLLCLFRSHRAAAVNASPEPVQVLQPDGTPIVLRIRGDEFFNWHEDLNGYTVVINNGQYVYAQLDASDRLTPTQWVVGKDNPQTAGLATRLLPTKATIEKIKASFSPAGGSSVTQPKPVAATGTVKNLVILCKFSDHTFGVHTRAETDYDTLMNKIGGDATLAPTGSLKDYYLETSFGTCTINSTVLTWVTLPHTEAYYANGTSGLGGNYPQNPQGMVEDALKLADPLVDFGQFDQDNDGFIDAIDIIHSGFAAETGGGGGNWMWSHKWSLFALPGGQFTSADNNSQGVKVKVYDYHTEAALWGTSGNAILRVGVIAHETGHFFGLPDLYDTDNTSEGIGSYCLMANSWGFDGTQYHPPIMSAWCKIQLGWVTPTVIGAGTYSAPRANSNPTAFRINSGYPSGEYLLIENRQPFGFESDMPQGGLAIWHIDDSKTDNRTEGYPGQSGWPGNNKHYRIALLQADGKYDLEKGNNRGDSGDVYHAAGVSLLGASTVPNTDAYQNGSIITTSNTISAISASGATMSFIFGSGSGGGTTPNISISDSTVVEGNSGTTNVLTVVTLSAASTQVVTVNFNTLNGTATAGSDYVTNSGSVSFPVGVTIQTITNRINGDTTVEANEVFYVKLTNPSGATLSDDTGQITIIDNDSGGVLDLVISPQTNAVALAQAITSSGSGGLIVKSANLISHSLGSGEVSSGTYSLIGASPHTYALTLPGVVLSTGNVMDYQTGTDTFNGVTTSYGSQATPAQELLLDPITGNGPTNFTHFDATQLDFVFDVAPGSNLVSFLVVFGSEEYPDFVNSPFIDGFGIYLNGTNIAFSGGLPININHPDFKFFSGTELNGVIAPGNNAVLQFDALVVSGSTNNTLTFIVADTSDTALDTTVYISSLRASKPPVPVYVSVGDTGLVEGNTGITNAQFSVSLSETNSKPVSVRYTTSNGSANSGSDFVSASGLIIFAPGVTNQTITVAVNGDTLNEANETFYVNLFNPTNAVMLKSQGACVITNDDPVATIVSVSGSAVFEGNSGLTNLVFTVNLSQPSGQGVTVNYGTSGGTGSPGSDYFAKSGQVFIPAGSTSQTVSITVFGDTLYEDNETVQLTLSSPVNALAGGMTATGYIINDDVPPTVSVGTASVFEGNSGLASMVFPITLSAPSGLPLTLQYITGDGTALESENDYVGVTNSVTIPVGQTNATVTVMVKGDTASEANEYFYLQFDTSYASPGSILTTGTILNDDGPLLSVSDVSVKEGSSPVPASPTGVTGKYSIPTTTLDFVVTLSQPDGGEVTVYYETVDGTALAGSDYVGVGSTLLHFATNETQKTVSITVNSDDVPENSETLKLRLSAATGATIMKADGVGTILDDDTLADLKLIATTSTNSAYTGHPVGFSMTVTNSGSFAATNVFLTNPIPANVAVSGIIASKGTYTNDNGVLRFSLGVMTNGSSASISYTMVATNGASYVNRLGVYSDQPDPNLADNTVDFSTTITMPSIVVSAGSKLLVGESIVPSNGAVDAGETVSVQLGLINTGNITTTNIVAQLVSSANVTLPGAQQSYGRLTNGGPEVVKTFTFTAQGAAGTAFTANLHVYEINSFGTTDLGLIPFSFILAGSSTNGSGTLIGVPTLGPATNQYPSVINISGLSGTISRVSVTLSNISHTYPADLDILLEGPQGQRVVLVSDVIGNTPVSGLRLTLDDNASVPVPGSGTVTGTYKPANNVVGDEFVGVPAGAYGSLLSAFNGTDPNGNWKLYVVDDAAGDSGSIGGWSLVIQTVSPVNPQAELSLTVVANPSPARVTSNVVYSVTVSNSGPAAATGVLLTNWLSSGVSYVSSTLSQGSIASTAGPVVYQLGTIGVGSSVQIAINTLANAPGPSTNVALVTAPQTDLQPANNLVQTVVRLDRLNLLTPVAAASGGNTFTMNINGAPGLTYVIEMSTNLSSPVWQKIATNTTLNGLVTFTDTNNPANQMRFYRAVEQ